jgi:hypothetical protein
MLRRMMPDFLRERRVELYRARAARKPGPSDFERAFSSCRMRDSVLLAVGAAGVVVAVATDGGASDGDGAAESVSLAVDDASEAVAVPKPGVETGADAAAAAGIVVTPEGRIGTVGTETETEAADEGVPALELPADDEEVEVRLYRNAEKAVLPGA